RGSDPAAARRALALAGGAHHGLHLEELLEAEDAPFAAVAGLLVAAERRGEVGAGAVQVHVAGAQPRRYALRVLEVARAHVARQPVRRVVRDADRLLLVAVREDREHGAEDLLARDGHVVAHVGEHGRAHVVALREALRAAGAAGGQGGALVDPLLDQALDLVPLRLAHDRTQRDAVRERTAPLGAGRDRLRDVDRLALA